MGGSSVSDLIFRVKSFSIKRMKLWRHILVAVMIQLAWAGSLSAETLQSNSYQIEESFIGGGGLIESSSTNFRSNESIGDVGIGNSASNSFQTNSGFTTTADPGLTFVINSSAINFGTLSTSVASTATSSFSVTNYTSHGYVIHTLGGPPKNGNYTLAAMSASAPSQAGVEQYGINLVRNTLPVNPLGADPAQEPDSSFSAGVAGTGYEVTNAYRYVEGEAVANAPKSSGRTTFTISYVINASSITPGGQYTGKQELICVGTY